MILLQSKLKYTFIMRDKIKEYEAVAKAYNQNSNTIKK